MFIKINPDKQISVVVMITYSITVETEGKCDFFKAPGNLLVDQCTYSHVVYLESVELEKVFTVLNDKTLSEA